MKTRQEKSLCLCVRGVRQRQKKRHLQPSTDRAQGQQGSTLCEKMGRRLDHMQPREPHHGSCHPCPLPSLAIPCPPSGPPAQCQPPPSPVTFPPPPARPHFQRHTISSLTRAGTTRTTNNTWLLNESQLRLRIRIGASSLSLSLYVSFSLSLSLSLSTSPYCCSLAYHTPQLPNQSTKST